jgi:hypothetical protein
MKNATKIFALALVLTSGASMVKAEGIIMGDRSAPVCSEPLNEGIIMGDRGGILVSDRSSGIAYGIITSIEQVLKGKDEGCASKDGIIMGDRDGIIMGD